MTSSVSLVGNLTRDPELRYTPNGAQVVTFGVAVNRRWQNRQTQQWEENVSFFNVTAWRDLADNIAQTLQKGSRVIVTGRLDQRSWTTESGEKRSVVEVTADEVGPSLRWATAQIHRNERKEGDGGAGASTDAWGGGGSTQPAPNEPPAAFDPAEEPF